MKNIRIETIVRTVIFAIVAVFLGLQILSRVDTFLKNQAIDQCARFGRFGAETTKATEAGQEKSSSDQPIQELFDKCLQEKGIR